MTLSFDGRRIEEEDDLYHTNKKKDFLHQEVNLIGTQSTE